jgi:hypothetical protein
MHIIHTAQSIQAGISQRLPHVIQPRKAIKTFGSANWQACSSMGLNRATQSAATSRREAETINRVGHNGTQGLPAGRSTQHSIQLLHHKEMNGAGNVDTTTHILNDKVAAAAVIDRPPAHAYCPKQANTSPT